MHKPITLAILAVLTVALCTTGCKSVTVTRHPATLAKVATADGGEKVATDSKGAPIVLDGGWEVEYFQHWNWQKFDAMSATAGPNVTFSLNGYEGGADASNLVNLVEVSFKGAAELTAKIGAAIATSGGSIAAEGGAKALAAAISRFISKGGDASKATVTCEGGNCTISDGTISEACEDCVAACADCATTK
jgi:hypothetical protein